VRVRIPAAIETSSWTISSSKPRRSRTKPITTRATATRTDPRTGRDRGGRAERAWVIGIRATVRAGHHAAATAVTTASAMPATTSHHGTCVASIR